MKILPISGKFYPKGDVPNIVCNHRYGADCSFTEGSDNYLDDAHLAAEAAAFKYNANLHNFCNITTGDQIADVIQATGRMSHDFYFPTDRWRNPTTGDYELIPDYYGAIWTSDGAEFFDVTIGETKTEKYPNHGQEIYEESNGVYGYDFTTDTIGSNELAELYEMVDYYKDLYDAFIGRTTSTYCFRNGKTGAKWLLKDRFLAGRTSDARATDDGATAYGFDTVDKVTELGFFRYVDWNENNLMEKACTTRWRSNGYARGDNDLAYGEATAFNIDQFNKTIANNGWYHDFVHWYYIYPSLGDQRELYYNDYLSQIIAVRDTNNVFMGGFGEIAEYFTLRDQIQKCVVTRTDNGFRFTLDRELYFSSTNDSLLNTPISIYIDFTGTSWEGQEFIVGNGVESIKKLDTNQFVFQVSKTGGYILDDATGSYLDYTKPTITTSYTGGILTVDTDLSTKVVVYGSDDANFYHIDTEYLRETDNFLTTRNLTISTGKNIFIGAIAENGQSELISVII